MIFRNASGLRLPVLMCTSKNKGASITAIIFDANFAIMRSMNNRTANLFVIAAPSGAGKTSLVKALSTSIHDLLITVSHTTRDKRPAEMNGQDYFFVNHAVFDEMIAKQAFLEYATVFGNHYGTSREWVTKQLAAGVDVILEIDWQGARQVRELFPQAILIFILPPSMETFKNHLQNPLKLPAALGATVPQNPSSARLIVPGRLRVSAF